MALVPTQSRNIGIFVGGFRQHEMYLNQSNQYHCPILLVRIRLIKNMRPIFMVKVNVFLF